MEQIENLKILELNNTENGCVMRISGRFGDNILDDVEVQLTDDGLHIVGAGYESNQEEDEINRAVTAAVCGKLIEWRLQTIWEWLRPLAANVQEHLARLNMSIEDLAKHSRIPLSHLRDLLEGAQEMHFTLMADDIFKLSRTLGILPDQLFLPSVCPLRSQ